ncbi:methyltransferase domain-containing protein [candidate division KSB1 bacterium]|nr:MAG: methyltransferase domain-containing protein [candidate division KSB1 bacterium]
MKSDDYLTGLLPARIPLPVGEADLSGEKIQPTIGPHAAKLLQVLIAATRPQRILEIGTSYGYAAIAMGESAKTYGGHITTVELNSRLADAARENIRLLGLENTIEVITANVHSILDQLIGPYGLILQDGHKLEYLPLLNPLVDKLQKSGLLITDDILFPVMDIPASARAWQEAVAEYNCVLAARTDLQTMWMPIGDGVAVSVKLDNGGLNIMNSQINLPQDQQRLYHDLAWLYRLITPPGDYIEECETFARMIRRHAQIPVKTLLNLGCGAGHHDSALKKQFSVTGADISESMLEMARKLNPEIEYLCGDMRTLTLNREFDVVTIFDSITYMLTESDVRAAFATACRHLNPGGVCLAVLDYTRENFIQNRSYCSTHQGDGVDLTFVQNYYDPDPADTQMECTLLFLIRRDGKLSMETDRHLCGLFPLQTWINALAETGFQTQTEIYRTSGCDPQAYSVLIGVRPK